MLGWHGGRADDDFGAVRLEHVPLVLAAPCRGRRTRTCSPCAGRPWPGPHRCSRTSARRSCRRAAARRRPRRPRSSARRCGPSPNRPGSGTRPSPGPGGRPRGDRRATSTAGGGGCGRSARGVSSRTASPQARRTRRAGENRRRPALRNLARWAQRERHASWRRPRRTAAADCPSSAPGSTACCGRRPSSPAAPSARRRARRPTRPAGTAAVVPARPSRSRCWVTPARRGTAWTASPRPRARSWPAASRSGPTAACTCGRTPSSARAPRTCSARSTGPCRPSPTWPSSWSAPTT